MRRVYVLIIGSILAVSVVSFVLLKSSRAWRTIATFSGDEGLPIRTQPFSVPSYSWRIHWNLTQKGSGNVMFSVAVYYENVDESDLPRGFFSYSSFPDPLPENNSKSGMYDCFEEAHVGKGDFYLEIWAVDCTWMIKVEALS